MSDMKAVEDELLKIKDDLHNSLDICSVLFQGQEICLEQEDALKEMLKTYLPQIFLYAVKIMH